MPQNFYELVWIFIVYAFIGWCTEVSYAALDRGVFVNRGFLNGPYCPIYGCGVVIVVAMLTPLKDNLLILFLGSFILTSVLEFITGFFLEKVFHNKWWDYSNKPFNIKGYVCLKFSVYWGLACTFIMEVLHPVIYKGIIMIPHIMGLIVLCMIMCVFAVDCGITVSTILKFNKRLKIMDELADKIHKLSDEIGENIYENVSEVMEKSEEFQENHAQLFEKIADTKETLTELPETAKLKLTETTESAKAKLNGKTGAAKEKITDTTESVKLIITENIMEARSGLEAKKSARTERTSVLPDKAAVIKKSNEAKKKEREELSAQYEKLFSEKSRGFRRLMKAFPDMTSSDRNESLETLKKYFNIKKIKDDDKKVD